MMRLLIAAGLSLCMVSAEAATFPVADQAELKILRNRIRASHFLSRATFGPTKADIDSLATRIGQIGYRRAAEEWIDAQFGLAEGLHEPLAEQMVLDDGFQATQSGINVSRYRQHAWWHNAIAAEDQLRQRVAWALAQIVVVSRSGSGFNFQGPGSQGQAQWLGLADYYDMLVRNSFGNYRDVLQDVSYHPIMGIYLSHLRNRKANPEIGRFPDENYAREVMQLFSIGVNELRLNGTVKTHRRGPQKGLPIETYTNEDIKAFARVFTGLGYGGGSNFWAPRTYDLPMEMYENEHDQEEKVLLNGTVLPAGQTGDQDVSDALDNLFNHPNCAPFIARRLIQRLVKSNPSKGYIRRVARKFNDNGEGVRGDMQAVVKQILLDGEARRSVRFRRILDESQLPKRVPVALEVYTRGTEWSRLREPVVRYAAMIRAFDPTNDYPTGRFMIQQQVNNLGQAPYYSPSVFNFYLPDHIPQGDLLGYEASKRIPGRKLFAPEFQILTSVIANRLPNRFRWDIVDQKVDYTLINNSTAGRIETDIFLDFADELALAETDPAALVDHLSVLLCQGTMSDQAKAVITAAITEESSNPEHRAEMAILTTLTSPACAIAE